MRIFELLINLIITTICYIDLSKGKAKWGVELLNVLHAAPPMMAAHRIQQDKLYEQNLQHWALLHLV